MHLESARVVYATEAGEKRCLSGAITRGEEPYPLVGYLKPQFLDITKITNLDCIDQFLSPKV
jgi:hypothetical protein